MAPTMPATFSVVLRSNMNAARPRDVMTAPVSSSTVLCFGISIFALRIDFALPEGRRITMVRPDDSNCNHLRRPNVGSIRTAEICPPARTIDLIK
jgi:hypothetical protein